MRYLKHKTRVFGHSYSLAVMVIFFPVLLLADLCLEIYHRTCFPVYGVAYVPRRKYIYLDRHKLSYLNWFQKVACAYCGYANGWVAFAVKVVGETEKYWCGIMHKDKERRAHESSFLAYGDEDALARYKKN